LKRAGNSPGSSAMHSRRTCHHITIPSITAAAVLDGGRPTPGEYYTETFDEDGHLGGD